MSMASTIGLNKLLCDPLAERRDGEGDGLRGAREPRRDGVSGISSVRGTGRNASADHSYQTCRVFVSRQRETVTSELLGRYNGSYTKGEYILFWEDDDRSTLRGKNRGNQLSMSLDDRSFR
jgi:hypothetical protein